MPSSNFEDASDDLLMPLASHHQLFSGQLESEILEIVLAGAPDGYRVGGLYPA
jgi:hypothetical protein